VATPDDKGGYTINKLGQTDTNQTAWHKDVAKQLNTLDGENRVTFGNAGKYAFDEYDKAYENSPYAKEYEILNDDYYVPWKLIPKGKSDQVSATLAGDIDPEKVIFKNTTGTVFNASRKGKTFEIDLVAASGVEGYELFAIYKEGDSVTKSLGKLKVTSYPLTAHKVKIVPMQASTIDAGKIREGLDAIYNKFGVQWEVEVLEPFTDTSWDEGETGLQTSGSGFFSEYTPEMKALNTAFDQAIGFDETSAYLFYFDQSSESNDLAGDMPLASQVGYIFSQSLDDKAIHTIAHELGHGVFHLKHPFSYDNNLKNATTNLMDYSGHEKLVKYQWDQVFKPKPVLFPEMQGEDEGVYIYEFLGKKYETLFDKVYSKNFTLNTEYYDKIQGGETNNFAPEFTDDELKEFSEEEKTWIKKWEVRARKSNDVLLDVIDAIQKASAGEKISKIIAQQDKVYIVKCNFDDYDFNVAIYGNGDGTTLNKIFTKVVVGKLEDLSLEENQKHLYVDVNEGRNYWIMALFEDEKKEPSLIVQISGKYNVLKAEKWLAFLNIINPKLTTLDKDPSFDWMEDVDLDDDISEEDLANIIENRNSVNDRTDKSIYGDDAMRSVTYNGRTGYMYKGEDKAEPEISGETEFEKEVKREIYNEIISEGGFSSVNTYDGEIFTWGKGFAINGQLKDVLKDMYENADFKQIFSNVGIKIVEGYIWVLDSEGNWKKDSKDAMDASNYIKSNTEILSFFIELAEKDEYSQTIANIQYNVFESYAADYPSYILKADKNSYADNWSHESVTVLTHLSHWLPAYSWSKGERYKGTKGDLDKILYEYIYNTLVKASVVRVSPTLETNIYRWSSNYDILGSLGRIGNPDGAGLEELNSTWNNHTIEIEFKTDNSDKLRAVKKSNKEYVSNTGCVLIKKDNKYIVVTKDGNAISYVEFKEKDDEKK
jgi:hypothetical protein